MVLTLKAMPWATRAIVTGVPLEVLVGVGLGVGGEEIGGVGLSAEGGVDAGIVIVGVVTVGVVAAGVVAAGVVTAGLEVVGVVAAGPQAATKRKTIASTNTKTKIILLKVRYFISILPILRKRFHYPLIAYNQREDNT
jgi:hypothetical protein